jgi:hypothetical protein
MISKCRLSLGILVLAGFLVGFVMSAEPSVAASWVHEISGAINSSPDFSIETVAEENGHLMVRGNFRPTGENYTAHIDGVKTKDGRFWPTCIAEVSDYSDKEWQRVECSISGQAASTPVSSTRANAMLHFNVDEFRPFIGKLRFGKLVLPNGREAVFLLTELLPNEHSDQAEQDWMLTTIGGGWPDPLMQSPFFIGGIAFENGHLRVIGSYERAADSSPVISGSRTRAEEGAEDMFWADGMLQVSNDPAAEWHTIGPAKTPGTPASITVQSHETSDVVINVCVDALRPLIAQFGYGRVVLQNGKSAAFRMKDLLPPKQRP